MKKLAITLVLGALMAFPAFAEVSGADIQADQDAVAKDNAALAKDRATLARHRAAKAQDKATDNYGDQAVQSTEIGADKTAISEKKTERHVDKKILKHDSKELNDQSNDQ